MNKIWHDKAWDEYIFWQAQDKKTLKRINDLIKDIDRHPFTGIGKPEPLKGNLKGCWSRRIDDANRIIYKAEGNQLTILQCGTHYSA
jgi:toxin YoeB